MVLFTSYLQNELWACDPLLSRSVQAYPVVLELVEYMKEWTAEDVDLNGTSY